ncbi:ABC transporter ATP-binding protein [Fictibacillus nanhaiensis]|uniref:ABC transporter ATP-binding protein n=1 Tax=Fictibacillus nanhaiensis TaxID=742169 RepID=A0ABS2ZMG5_9BACL|nr:ABC transporter ATP-binding protein [Fictibacillus nanhaiensis]
MIKVEQVYKTYINKHRNFLFFSETRQTEAVCGVDLYVNPGEIVGLLGMNGAGKTTLIKMMSTLLSPTSGTITIDGMDVVKDALKVKSIVNMIAGGERMLYFRLTGRQNLEYFGNLYGLRGSLLKDRINYLLSKVGLEKAADTPVERYSKGMKQRLQIARGLINDPKYLFLDEPTLGLDVSVAKRLREFVQELVHREGKGIVLTSHYLEEIEELCDRVYIANNGRIIMHDTPKNLVFNITHGNVLNIVVPEINDKLNNNLRTLIELHNANIEISSNEEGILISIKSKKDITTEVVQTIYNSNVNLISLYIEKPKLEDAILQLENGVA